MCGRFLNTHPSDEIARAFRVILDRAAQLSFARWNVAPSQPIRVVRDVDGQREMAGVKWGFVPTWAKSPSDGPRPINARAETIDSSGAFRGAFAKRRCVVPASGFYEWQAAQSRRAKRPFALLPSHESEMFAFAGVWERWGDDLETCAIITTTPNAVMKPIHDRMPVILPMDEVDTWLDAATPAEQAKALLRPCDPGAMRALPVSRHVNSPAHDDPHCLDPEPPDEPSLF